MFRKRLVIIGLGALGVLAVWPSHRPTKAQAPPPGYANFEGSQTNPIRLSADGTRMFAVNTPNGTVSVFDITTPASPNLLAEIPVGIEPVSVNPTSDDAAWVVNQVSNSISLISVSQGMVLHTINLKTMASTEHPFSEPMDVVFANNQAYVSVSRSNTIAVIDMDTLNLIKAIPVFGGNPRAMAVSPDGSTVYAAFALSGNQTTLIPAKAGAPPQPPPTNPALPPPPVVGLIVNINDPAYPKQLSGFKMPDNDVVAIATGAKPAIAGYYSGVGTINLGLAVNPITGDLFVSNTDALNLTHFETNLCGHYVNNRVTRIQVASGTITPFDLNPNVVYGCTPNSADLSIALAQPAGEVFDPSGNFLYVAAFGTDRVAKVDTNGNVLSFVEVALASGSGSNVDPSNKRGPRGLALTSDGQTLYSLNRLSNTISVIDGPNSTLLSEVPVGNDPTPANIKAGRGFLYDAKLSGTGTGSCASCHIDGDMDHLAWDLGNPGGNMTSIPQPNGQIALYHPMKGAMTTQTMRGLAALSPYHWRGDKPAFSDFNGAFPGLMGGNQLSDTDMANYTAFANSINYLPNPYTYLNGSYPTQLGYGNTLNGVNTFMTVALTGNKNTCAFCHAANPGPGSNRGVIIDFIGQSSTEPLKVPQLRNMYQKELFTKGSGTAIDGFGMNHDGGASGFLWFIHGKAFHHYTQQQKYDMFAYMLCFDTGTEPAVGFTRTLRKWNVGQYIGEWNTLQSQAALGHTDLVANGTLGGVLHGLLYSAETGLYTSEVGVTYTQAQLEALVKAGDTLTIMGAYPGTGTAIRTVRHTKK